MRNARAPTVVSTPSADTAFTRPRRPQTRRRIKSPAFAAAAAAAVALARRAGTTAGGGRRSGPTTPLLRWKFEDGVDYPGAGKVGKKDHNAGAAVSARKLAAGIWHLQQNPEVGNSGRAWLGFEPNRDCLHTAHDSDHNVFNHHDNPSNGCLKAISVHQAKNDMLLKLGASAAPTNTTVEGATKWDPGASKASDEVFRIYSHLKLLEDQQMSSDSVVSSLRSELAIAHAHITELQTERQSAKKKLDNFLGKLAEEKASWRSREHEKIRAAIDAMKDDFKRERKTRQRMEIVNSKLVSEVADAKITAKRLLHDYEKERKARELMEEVCEELAKEVAEDKAEVDILRRESETMQEEVEEERRMLQMAEVWREERVQMKLIDAKLTLEDKYSQLSKVQADLEAFLRLQSQINLNIQEVKEAELLRDAANLLKVQEIEEFSYQPPPASEDICSFFEELQPQEDANEREIEQCYGYSPESRASKLQASSPDINVFLEKPMKRYADGFVHVQDDSDWETVSHKEEEGSSNSSKGSGPSVNGGCKESNSSLSGKDWEDSRNKYKFRTEISDAYSSMTKQSKKKASSIIRFLRSSSPKYKKHSDDATNGRISNVQNLESCLSSPSVGRWSSPDSVNSYITRGTKGQSELLRGTQKQSLKSKLVEARTESQKVQIRHVLKQKI